MSSEDADIGTTHQKTDLTDSRDVDRKAVGHLGEHAGLKRTVGFKSVIGLNLASMLGSCLLLPGIANSLTGSSAFFAIIVSAIAVLPACLSKGELATAMPYSGGDYIYLARAFGPLLGAITGIGVWFDLLFQAIFGLRGSTEYIKVLFGDVDEAILKVLGVVLLLCVLLLNLSGMKWLKAITKWYTLLIMIVLLAVALACFGSDDSTNQNFENHFFTEGPVGFFETAAYVHMGYGGLTKICAVASEVKNPGFNLPWGMLISLCVMVAWFATVTSCMASITPDITKTDYAPFYTMGKAAVNEGMGKFCAILCVFGMASMGNVSLLAVARFPFAMARDGLLPLQFEAIWHRTSAPWFSLCFCSFFVAIAIVTLPINRIVKLASSFKIIIFIMCNVSIFVFRGRKPAWYQPEFMSPLYPVLQIVGIVFGVALLCLMNIEGAIAALVIIFMGVIAYMSYGRYYAKFMGVIKPEEYLNLVPLAYVEMQKQKESDQRQHSVSNEGQALLTFMIHDPAFLADWRNWKHEEIMFWFVHVGEGKYEKYTKILGNTVPKYLETGEDLKYLNDLILRNLGIEDRNDRRAILEDLFELRLIQKPQELWASGVSDVDSLYHRVSAKEWISLRLAVDASEDGESSGGLDWFDKMSTEMAKMRVKSGSRLQLPKGVEHMSAATTI